MIATVSVIVVGIMVAWRVLGPDLRGPRRAALAAIAGPAVALGTLSLAFFAWRLLGFQAAGFRWVFWVALVATVTTVAHGRRGWPSGIDLEMDLPRTAVDWVSLIVFVVAMVLVVRLAFLYAQDLALGRFDAWAIWNSRAKLLYRSSDLSESFSYLAGPHPDYPLLLPGSVAALFAATGSDSVTVPQLVGAIFVFACVGGVVVGVRALGGPSWASWLAGGVLLLTPMMVWWGFSQCADVPLAYLLCLSAVLLAWCCEREDPPVSLLVFCGYVTGLMIWTKGEGLVLSAILLAGFASIKIWRRSGPREVLWVTAGATVPLVALLVFRSQWVTRWELRHFLLDLSARIFDPARIAYVASGFLERLNGSSRFDDWVLTWPLVLIGLVVTLAGPRRQSPSNRFLILSVILIWVAWFGIFVGTPHSQEWHIRTALDRLLLQILPVTLMLSFSGLGFLDKRLSKRRGAAET